MTPDATTSAPKPTKHVATRRCPVCGGEAWRIAYGMIAPNVQEQMPKTEFAGCCIEMEVREDPATGKTNIGTPKWACQNPECRYRWW